MSETAERIRAAAKNLNPEQWGEVFRHRAANPPDETTLQKPYIGLARNLKRRYPTTTAMAMAQLMTGRLDPHDFYQGSADETIDGPDATAAA